MSKSLNNAIYLGDDADSIQKKVMGMYTDPNRKKATDPGTVENNPLWIFHETFNPDRQWVTETEDLYRRGLIGDVPCKKKLVEVLVTLIEPIRQRRVALQNDPGHVLKVLQDGTRRAREVADETLRLAKKCLRQDYL
jgi:tryptophanyl-tRNA synthetase